MKWWHSPLLLCLATVTDSCISSGSSYSNHPKSTHGPCGSLRDAVHECTYLNEEECKLAIKSKSQITCKESQGMFLKGDMDSFPINSLICDSNSRLWMVDGGRKTVFETVGDDVGVACYDRIRVHSR